ncbi:MAG: phage holin family protein [Candidatus Woodwardiibium sp.]
MDWNEYLKPELSVLIPVLYLVGAALKKTSVGDWRIPFLLGGGGILLTALYLLSTAFPGNGPQLFALLFSAVTQGILGAAGAVYANNLLKQYSKRKEGDQDADT